MRPTESTLIDVVRTMRHQLISQKGHKFFVLVMYEHGTVYSGERARGRGNHEGREGRHR